MPRSTRLSGLLGGIAVAALVATSMPAMTASADPIAVTISGTVYAQWGDPSYGATVELFGESETDPVDTVTAEDGSFAFEVTEPGDYRVRASQETFDTRWWQDATSFGDAAVITIEQADVADIAITLPVTVYSLSGTVTAGPELEPLEGVGVEVVGTGGGYTELVTTDENGHYEIYDLPIEGKIHFIGVGEYANEWFDDVPDEASATSVTFDKNRIVDVALAEAGTISGTVRGPVEVAGPVGELAGATVTLFTAGGSYVTEAYTDDDGVYSFAGVAPGSYRLGFTGAGGWIDWTTSYYGGSTRLSLSTVVTLADSLGLTGIDATIKRVPGLSGVVLDGETGEPVTSGRVALHSLNGTFISEDWLSDGKYLFRDLPSGAYLLEARFTTDRARTWYGGGVSSSSATPVVVKHGVSVLGKNITVQAAGSIAGTISAETSTSNAHVELYTPRGQLVQSAYVYDGEYTIYGVKPGKYLLRFVPQEGLLLGEWWKNSTTRTGATAVTVVAGERTQLANASLASKTAGRITGHIVNGAGSDVMVEGPGIDNTKRISADDSGDFAVENLAPGAFQLYFSDGQAKKVAVASGRTSVAKTVTLREKILVDVAAEADGTPVLVEFFTLKGVNVATEFAYDGAVQIEVPRDRYKVRFSNWDGESSLGLLWLGGKASFASSDILDLRTTDASSIAAVLPTGSTFSARVVEKSRGKALDGVGVEAWRLEPDGHYERVPAYGTTDTDGRFTVRGLGAGTHKFRFVDESYGTYRDSWYGGTSLASANPVQIALTPTARAGKIVTRLTPVMGTVGVKAPVISGTMKVGNKLTAKTSFTWPSTGVKKTYRWYRDGAVISRATGVSYKLTRADAGKEITVRVSGSRSGYTSSGTLSLPRNTRD